MDGTIASTPPGPDAPSARPVVRLRQVSKTFHSDGGNVAALRGIDLDVNDGELLMLVGPSGCGKTTLISVLAGILDRDDGELDVFGHDWATITGSRRARVRGQVIGFVFQAFNLLPTLTAVENAAVPLLIRGTARSVALAKAAELLAEVGLSDRLRSLPSQMSGGQQQRVAIARALVHEPRLIVCDEPTSALDHATGEQVMRLLRRTAIGAGRALIIVTHDARIFGHGDRVATMDDGRVVSVTTGAAAAAAH